MEKIKTINENELKNTDDPKIQKLFSLIEFVRDNITLYLKQDVYKLEGNSISFDLAIPQLTEKEVRNMIELAIKDNHPNSSYELNNHGEMDIKDAIVGKHTKYTIKLKVT